MANQPRWNITPLHQSLTTFTTSSSHSSLTQFLNPTNAAFQNLHSFNSNSTHSSTASAGFQYYFNLTSTASSSAVESIPVYDSQFEQITVYQTEGVSVADSGYTGIKGVLETVPVSDTQVNLVTVYQTEGVSATDSESAGATQEQTVPVLDTQFEYITIQQEEDISATDSESAVTYFQTIDSMQIGILASEFEIDSMQITNLVYESDSYSMCVGIKQSNITPVVSIVALPTSAYSPPTVSISQYNTPVYTSPISVSSNPFTPTVILGGTTYSTYSGTAPSVSYPITSNTYFVQWLNAGITGVNSCTIVNFNIELDRSGGSWSFATTSTNSFTLGEVISIFGLNGTITGIGQIVSNSQVGQLVKGVFGVPAMNKPLNLLLAGSTYLFALLTNSQLTNPALTSNPLTPPSQSGTMLDNTYSTYAAVAQELARIAGINLSWQLPHGDIPLLNFTLSEGETVQSALSSIATQFGGYLLWDGQINYTIGPPNTVIGGWGIPDKSLIAPAGIQYTQSLDLSTGVSGQGIFTIPIVAFSPIGLQLPSSAPNPEPQVQVVSSTSRQFSNQDPLWNVDLPLDTEEVWIQILVQPYNSSNTPDVQAGGGDNAGGSADTSTNGDTGGGNGTGNYLSSSGGSFNAGGTFGSGGYSANPAATSNVKFKPKTSASFDGSASQFVVSDPTQWISIGNPGIFGNQYVKLVNQGGAIKPQAQIPYTFIPTADQSTQNNLVNQVTNGNFIMSVGVTRNNQQAIFNDAKQVRDLQIQVLMAQVLGSLGYVQTYEGTINSYFFGSIPIPGCGVSVTACGTTVAGIVESVNFSYPGMLNVTVGQYAQIDYTKNYYTINNGTVIGGLLPPGFNPTY